MRARVWRHGRAARWDAVLRRRLNATTPAEAEAGAAAAATSADAPGAPGATSGDDAAAIPRPECAAGPDAAAEMRAHELEVLRNFTWRAAQNFQVAVAVPGSGAPVHHHFPAASLLLYGMKQWFATPPAYRLQGRKQVRRWAREDVFPSGRTRTPARPRHGDPGPVPFGTCTQLPGDLLFMPAEWGHGVLNHMAGIAVATEMLRDNIPRGHMAPPQMNALAFAPIVAEALTEVITANEIVANTWTETPLAYGSVGVIEGMLEEHVKQTVDSLTVDAQAAAAAVQKRRRQQT